MPVYEYECSSCGQIQEAFQKVSDKPLTKCRHCSGNIHKIISHSTFHLKGSGWYVTDYAGKSGSKAISSNKKDAPGDSSASKPSTPSESSSS
jgi:putative FmdB family regulatory protein